MNTIQVKTGDKQQMRFITENTTPKQLLEKRFIIAPKSAQRLQHSRNTSFNDDLSIVDDEVQSKGGNHSRDRQRKRPEISPLMVQRPDILTLKMYNKIEGSSSLSNKKSLFFNLMEYYQRIGVDPYLTLPLTFHIKDGLNSPSFNEFKQEYE